MDTMNTIVGYHLLNMFPEGIAFNIATFVEPTWLDKLNDWNYEEFYRTLLTADRKGRHTKFPQYCKN